MNVEQLIYFAISHILMGWIVWTCCRSFKQYSDRIGELQKEIGRLQFALRTMGVMDRESDETDS
jgi:hypothetical protein